MRKPLDWIGGGLVGAAIIGVANATITWFRNMEPIYVFLIWFGISFVVITGITKWQESRLARHLKIREERGNKVREERRTFRQSHYADRANIPQLLLSLHKYAYDNIHKQRITTKDYPPIVQEFGKSMSKLSLIRLGIAIRLPPTVWPYLRLNSAIGEMLTLWSGSLHSYGLGMSVISEHDTYKKLYTEITEKKAGLFAPTISRIDQYIIMSNLLCSLVLMMPAKKLLRTIKIPGKFSAMLPHFQLSIDVSMGKLLGLASKDIEQFLLGE